MPAAPYTPEQEAQAARVATFRLTLDNAHDPDLNPHTERFTGTLSQAFARAGEMWNAHPVAVIQPERGWRLRGREVLNVNSTAKEKLGRIQIDIA